MEQLPVQSLMSWLSAWMGTGPPMVAKLEENRILLIFWLAE